MNGKTRKRKLDAWLPPLNCSQSVRNAILEIATREQRSIADVQREAVAFYLDMRDTFCVIHSGKEEETESINT